MSDEFTGHQEAIHRTLSQVSPLNSIKLTAIS
jgi:hypothetical protein